MATFTDITGRIFGDLTVIELAGKDQHNATVWRCSCVCGYKPVIRRNDLIRGKSKSCGCSKKRRHLK